MGMCAGEEEVTESKFSNFFFFYIVIHLYKGCFETMTDHLD